MMRASVKIHRFEEGFLLKWAETKIYKNAMSLLVMPLGFENGLKSLPWENSVLASQPPCKQRISIGTECYNHWLTNSPLIDWLAGRDGGASSPGSRDEWVCLSIFSVFEFAELLELFLGWCWSPKPWILHEMWMKKFAWGRARMHKRHAFAWIVAFFVKVF